MCLKPEDVERMDSAQTAVNEAAFDQNWIVYGPAGTGKTILALNRLQRLSKLRPDEDHVFISKSKMLSRWVEQAAIGLGQNNKIQSFDQYVWHKVKSYIGCKPITLSPTATWSEISWSETTPLIADAFKQKPNMKKFSVIVDEGQDISAGFFEACKIMCSRVFILMDENQKTKFWADTARAEAARMLNVDQRHQRYLGINYRNPKVIKELSETFYDGDVNELASDPPVEFQKNLEADPSIRYLPLDDETKKIDQVRRIIGFCSDRPQSTVCVVAPSPSDVPRVIKHLQDSALATNRFDKNIWKVRGYIPKRGQRCTTDFCSPGIVIANALNLKGSEFDAVYLVDWHRSEDPAPAMYTLIARARARIEIFADPTEESKLKMRHKFEKALSAGLIKEMQ